MKGIKLWVQQVLTVKDGCKGLGWSKLRDYGVSVAHIAILPSKALLALPLTLCQSVSLGYEAGPVVGRRVAWERQTLAKGGGMTKAEISLACGCDAEKGVIGGQGRGEEEEEKGNLEKPGIDS